MAFFLLTTTPLSGVLALIFLTTPQGGAVRFRQQTSESIMIYLVAIFTPPIYFIVKKKWLAAVLTSGLFIFSVCLFFMIPILWPICAICAVWDLRKSLMQEHAQIIGQEVRKAMRQEQPLL